eukprot:gene16310-4968_t
MPCKCLAPCAICVKTGCNSSKTEPLSHYEKMHAKGYKQNVTEGSPDVEEVHENKLLGWTTGDPPTTAQRTATYRRFGLGKDKAGEEGLWQLGKNLDGIESLNAW